MSEQVASPDSLGILAKSASGPVAARHLKRWRLREAIVELLPGARVGECGTRVVPGRSAAVVLDGGRAYLAGVRRCGSVWHCPYCAAKIARSRALELRRAVDAALARGWHVTLATWTIGHGATDELPELLGQLTGAMRRWRGGRSWKALAEQVGYVGSVRNLECTWGEGSGWHPHSHGLLITRDRLVGSRVAVELGARWAAAVAAEGGYASDVYGLRLDDAERAVAGYLAKADGEVEDGVEASAEFSAGRRSWAAPEELAFSHLKVARSPVRLNAWGLAAAFRETGDQALGDRFIEYAAAFHGRRHLYWSRGLRDVLELGEELTDVQLAEAPGEQEIVAVTIRPQDLWRLVDGGHLPALLAVAEERGGWAAQQWLWEWSGEAAGRGEWDPELWTDA